MSDSIINEQEEAIQVDYEKGNFSFPEDYTYDAGTGLNEETVAYISKVKNEAEWVKEFRLKALEIFNKKPMPTHWASKDLENMFLKIFVIIFLKDKSRVVLGMKSLTM